MIYQVIFNNPTRFKHKGDLIASMKYNDYQVEVAMPVDGKLIKVNTDLVNGDQNLLVDDTEGTGWVALIGPSQLLKEKI